MTTTYPPLSGKFAAGAKVGPLVDHATADEVRCAMDAVISDFADFMNDACYDIHAANVRAGWWSDLATGKPIERNVFEMLGLIHSEISEAFEAHRKGLRDDKLLQHPGIAVELADAVIRIMDLAGSMDIKLGDVIREKVAFNRTRADHTLEARRAAGGKAV